MQYQDFMMSGMIFNIIDKALHNLKTGVIYFDILITIGSLLLYNIFSDNKKISDIYKYFINFFSMKSEEKSILFISKKGACSHVFKSLLYFLSEEPNKKNISSLIEDINSKYNTWGDYNEGDDNRTLYRVNQLNDFNFTENIRGRISTEKEETTGNNGKVKYEEYVNLEIFTTKLTLEELKLFVEKCHKSYKKKLKEKLISNQSIITIESAINKKKSSDDDEDINIKKKDWISFKTFDNTFFPDIECVVKKIEFFINNREWYEKKGLPWTLGIMLSGIPGSGKTSFIKALMNYTSRHCVNVKLDDDFKMSELETILGNEEIHPDIIIPIEKRIVVLEDIDCMGDIVKDRDIIKEEKLNENLLNNKLVNSISDNKLVNSSHDNKVVGPIITSELLKKESKFNLSKLLNIIDGLDEHPGRILVITTNKPDRLDKALIRPGRIDIRLNFENSVDEDIHKILNHFWDNKSCNLLENSKFKKFDKMFSPASIINFCRICNSYEDTLNLLEQKYLDLKSTKKINSSKKLQKKSSNKSQKKSSKNSENSEQNINETKV